jgi:hypothetical protein
MSVQSTSNVIYQIHPDTASSMKKIREQLHQACGCYLNHAVRIQTMDGHMFEGTIMAIDSGHLYLSVNMEPAAADAYSGKRAFYPYYYPRPPYYPYPYYNPGRAILPLVLYELLAVSLL